MPTEEQRALAIQLALVVLPFKEISTGGQPSEGLGTWLRPSEQVPVWTSSTPHATRCVPYQRWTFNRVSDVLDAADVDLGDTSLCGDLIAALSLDPPSRDASLDALATRVAQAVERLSGE
jgi:hypothetical protein